MLWYYLFWMFMGFILHIYIIFGTNLLTGGPACNSVFFLFQYFGVQTEWNLQEHDFWNERDPEAWSAIQEAVEAATRVEGTPRGVGVPPYLVPSLLLPLRTLQVFWIASVPKITLPKVSFRLDSVWYSFYAEHWNKGKNRNWHWALG